VFFSRLQVQLNPNFCYPMTFMAEDDVYRVAPGVGTLMT
jgi:hypothetical protein